MSFANKTKVSFQVLGRLLARGFSRIRSEMGDHENIELTERLFLRVPKERLTLFSYAAGGGESVLAMDVTIQEARAIFKSIKRACELRELVEIKVGELRWKTDARRQAHPDGIMIEFDGPLGYTRTIAKRADVEAAVAEFDNRFEHT